MRPKLYLETTIPSYLTARPSRDLIVAGHQQITQEWWSRRKNDFSIYISQFVLDEARGGDRKAARDRLSVISQFQLLEVTDEVTELSSAIVESHIIPRKSAGDAAHIAIAAVHNMQFLMMWNCTHIANAEMASAIQSVCDTHAFECPIICTPEELLGE